MPPDNSEDVKIIKHQNSSICMIIPSDVIMSDRLQALAQTIKAVAEQQNIPLFLVDFRQLPYEGSILALYELAYSVFDKIGFQRSWKTGLLVKVGDTSYDFLETVACNNAYKLRCFQTMDEAFDWLIA